MRTGLVIVLSMVPLAACTEDDSAPRCTTIENICYSPAALACRDRAPTIATGLYGCAITVDDSSVFPATPRPGVSIQLLDRASGTPIVVTTSDADGFYQLAPPAGTYVLCEPDNHSACSAPLAIAEGATRAVDTLMTAQFWWQPR